MRTLLLLAVSTIAFADAVPARGQWVNGQCAPAAFAPVGAATWKLSPSGEQFWLMDGSRQIGTWVIADGKYWSRDTAGNWMQAASPVDPPIPPTGVVRDHCASSPRCSINGKEHSKDAVRNEIEASSKIPDNTAKRRITVIGPEAERKAALAKIGYPEWAVVSDWNADDWQVVDSGFTCTGKPTIYITEPNGDVLHRQDGVDGIETALGRADPKYDPTADPDLRKNPAGPDAGNMVYGVHVQSGLVGGVIGLLASLAFKLLPLLTAGKAAAEDQLLTQLAAKIAARRQAVR